MPTIEIPAPPYLVAFHPKRIPHYFTDILIVGGGLAGLRAAIAVDPKLSVVVVTKDEWRESNSNYAQGGIASVMDPEDSFQDHIEDTLAAGGQLCDREVVETVIKDAPARINELIGWGTQFDSEDGELSLGREGGHQHNRILHAMGDATGKEIMRAVIHRAREREHTQMWQHTFTIDLIAHEGRCRGALVWNPHHGRTFIWAKQTILCTGGVGQVYRETTNPPVATGDGHAMAFRAGATLRDMEFVQFHPTVLYIAGSSRSLITEAMRGEGAHLVDATGHRFMPDYDPRAELAPRDIVSQAIVAQMQQTRRPNVYLDLSHLDGARMRRRFPGIAKTCAEFGIDIGQDQIPVRPGAHYMIGGVIVDADGRTTLPGLWAAGEATSSGLHGANRLASNSLLEGLVYGVRAAERASEAASEEADDLRALPITNATVDAPQEPLDLVDIRNSLKSLMWRAAGVRREADTLRQASASIESWCNYVLNRQLAEPEGWELQNMLLNSRLMIEAALRREESRGVHLRTDFPEKVTEWEDHILLGRSEPA
ncbi:MAG: L-aspartate oxidase [Planctomycetota bacterium]